MDKIIFLDVDGVLNRNAPGEFKETTYDGCIEVLKELVSKTGAKIILSSGWKRFFDDDMRPLNSYGQQLTEDLSKYGLILSGRTADFSTEEIVREKTFDKCKPSEILDYVHRNDLLTYVVIDDLPLTGLGRHLYMTDHKTGLIEADVNKIIDILK